MGAEGELGFLVVIEQGQLLHVEAEADEIEEELILAVQSDQEEACGEEEALVVLAPVVGQEEVFVEVGEKDAPVLAHELDVLAARGQLDLAQIQLAEVRVVARALGKAGRRGLLEHERKKGDQ